MSTKLQAVIGLASGVAGSFSVLQHVTDRRLMARPRADADEKDAFRYEILLYRKMWEFSDASGSSEYEAAKVLRRGWNAALSVLPGAISSAGNSLTDLGDSVKATVGQTTGSVEANDAPAPAPSVEKK